MALMQYVHAEIHTHVCFKHKRPTLGKLAIDTNMPTYTEITYHNKEQPDFSRRLLAGSTR
jgi:hypothetical protein